MNAGESDFFNHARGFFDLLPGLSRKSGQDIRGKSRMGEFTPKIFHSPQILVSVIAAPHPAQHRIAAGLEGQVKLGTELIRLTKGSGEFRRGNGRLQGTQTYPEDAIHLLYRMNHIQEGNG